MKLATSFLVLAACASHPARPIPPRPPPATLDPAFFAAPDDPATPKMRVHLIDVGQGAATLVEFSCGAILIDTGGESNRRIDSTYALMTYLNTFFESRPDLENKLAVLVLTHPHIDHTRGAQVVMGEFAVQNLVTDGHTTSSGGKQQRLALSAAAAKKIPSAVINTRDIPAGGLTNAMIDPLACADGDPDIRVLWGAVDKGSVSWSSDDLENYNNQSVVVKITLGATSLLVTGDLELDEAMVAKHAGTKALDVDVYEVGHHGSFNASSDKLLAAMTPKIALIACGPYDRKNAWTAWAYGHPRAVALDRLEKAVANERPLVIVPAATTVKTFDGRDMKKAIYATGWDSDVIVTMFADGTLSVKTRRQ